MDNILYLGWLGYNNLGDELMWEIFNNLCNNYLDNHCEVTPSPPDISLMDIDAYDTIVLGGGSILLPDYINWIYHAMEMGKKIIVWGSGYDWAEHRYVDMLENSSSSHFLFDEKTEQQIIDVVNNSKFIGVRGPLTYSLLKSANVDMNKVCISGDPGLLLKPGKLPSNCPIFKNRKEDKIIALNWGTSKNDIYGEDEEYVENQLAKVCKILLEQNYKIYIYNMWPIDIPFSKSLYNKVGLSQNLIFDTNLYTAGELMRILQKCTFSINFKLHGNVISAAAGTPFVCLGYRFKCFDFVKSLDLNELIVSTDKKFIKEEILSTIDFINSHSSLISYKLLRFKNKYSQLLLKPFENGVL